MSKISDELRGFTNTYDLNSLQIYELKRIDAETVELPKDADGVTIRVGDSLDGYGKTIEVVEMRYGRGGWVLISRDGSGYADTFAFAHRHEPTVEDVLRECCHKYHSLLIDDMNDAINGVERDYIAPDEIIAEYAAKLRLAGDVE